MTYIVEPGGTGSNNDKTVSATTPKEIYCAAWTLVLARHHGEEDGEVAFGYADASTAISIHEIRVAYSSISSIDDLLQNLKARLRATETGRALSVASLCTLGPFPSMLTVGPSSIISEDTLDGKGVISILCDEYQPDKDDMVRHPNQSRQSVFKDILLAQLKQAILQLRTLAPSTALRDVNLFTEVDRERLLQGNSEPPPQVDETLCSLFAQHVQLQPEAPAVSSWDRCLSYEELNIWSRRIAGELVRRGVHPQETVSLCFDKSALAIVTMMAVLRVGASFVNLGISTPVRRQASILEASSAVLLITDNANASSLGHHQSVVGIQLDWKSVEALSEPDSSLPEVKPHYVAAITFTSGTTGKPKGIVVEHGSIATSCEAMSARYNIGPHSRILQFASYTFDASVGDIFYGLARGACICSPSEHERVNDLAATARRMQVNWAFLTPSVLSLLVPKDIPSLRWILHGGEPPSPSHVALWAKSVELYLVMGPAECAIYCAGSGAVKPGQDTSTFGRAAGCRMWLVDSNDHTKLAPVGCPGELVVEGRTVARGYLNAGEQAREVFLDGMLWLPKDLQGPPSTRRFYLSGDLARFNVSDGTFSFIARKDKQVKLYGQRVELGEIEHHLKEAEADLHAAAAVLNTSPEQTGTHPLVAFLVFKKGSERVDQAENSLVRLLSPSGMEALRTAKKYLETVLPAYMIPSLFIPIRQIPFTLSGKRDVDELRRIVASLSSEELRICSLVEAADIVSRPLSAEEGQLQDLWAQVLQVELSSIAPSSDFVQSGGDSLAAMRLATIAARSGLHLPVSTILQHPSLADMALSMRSKVAQEEVPDPYSLLPKSSNLDELKTRCANTCSISVDQIEDIYPTAPPQKMLMGAALISPGTYVLRLTFRLPSSSPDHLEKFRSAWNKIVAAADILRARIVPDAESGPLQVVTNRLEWDEYEDMEEYNKQDYWRRLGYGSQLYRLAIVRKGRAGSPVFAFMGHHALYDGFALNIIFDRVAEVFKTGTFTSLMPYKTYISYLQASFLANDACRDYWRQTLENTPAPIWPPKTEPGNLTTSQVTKFVALPLRPKEFTLAVVAQAAFTLITSDITSTDDVILCMSFSGRDAALPSILDIPGPTLFTVPFRQRINRQATLYELLDSIRTNIATVSKFGHLGVAEIWKLSEDCRRACDFRALFAVQPREIETDVEVFGERLSFDEDMGRLPLIFEMKIVEGGVTVVAEYNVTSLGKQEVEVLVQRFTELLDDMVGMDFDTVVGDIDLRGVANVVGVAKVETKANGALLLDSLLGTEES